MKFDGGYNVMLEGEPGTEIASYQKPEVLYLPLFSDSLDFSLLLVEHGEEVAKGQILAKDPVNFSVPLLAPMDGTVNLELAERYHITACMECGCCAYTCPANIPLVQLIRTGKVRLHNK